MATLASRAVVLGAQALRRGGLLP